MMLMLAAVLSGSIDAKAQRYEPTETYPFLYEDFTPGVVRNDNGYLINYAQGLNISAVDGKLFFLKDNVIMVSDMSTVIAAKIGDDIYFNAGGGGMMKILGENENGAVLVSTRVDAEKMRSSNIGYGISSATATTQNVNSLASIESNLANVNFNDLISKKNSGSVLPLIQKRCLSVGIIVVPASRKAVSELSFVKADEAKAFFKAEKIKWDDTASLLKVVDFLAEQNKK